jgi:hypothetical protein
MSLRSKDGLISKTSKFSVLKPKIYNPFPFVPSYGGSSLPTTPPPNPPQSFSSAFSNAFNK